MNHWSESRSAALGESWSTSGIATAAKCAAVANAYFSGARTSCPAPRSAPVAGSEVVSDAVRAAIADNTFTSAPETFTVASPSPPSTAGSGASTYSQPGPSFQGPRGDSSPCDML